MVAFCKNTQREIQQDFIERENSWQAEKGQSVRAASAANVTHGLVLHNPDRVTHLRGRQRLQYLAGISVHVHVFPGVNVEPWRRLGRQPCPDVCPNVKDMVTFSASSELNE